MKILIAFIVFIFSAQCSSNNIQPFEAHEKCLSNNTLCNRRNASSVNSIPANTNMVNYSIQTGTTSYEVFDSSTFHNRSLSQETTDPLSQIISQNNMPKSIISTDERFQITNAKIQPYLSTAKLIATYYNVYNQATKEYQKITYSGTAFMAGSNIALTAGHCCYTDVTNTGNYNDNINNPRFPDKIELFFGCDQSADINQGSSYQCVNSKNGSIWSINISNTTSHLREVYYNSKMCNFSDAHDWTNLKDIETIIIYPYQTKMVTIRENWFATSITVSYIYHSHRVITYADNLHLGDAPGLDEESNILPI